MYGQEGSFNPRYHHGAPPQAGVTGPFPQQPQPPPPPQQQQQAGVTGPLPQQPVPPRPASYPQYSVMRPPPGPYTHSVPQFQNPAYPFTQHGQMHQGPMGAQQTGFAPMPISGPPPLAMYKAPQNPMQRPLPPPPPQPSSFAPENVPPPSHPPPPPPPPPPPLAPQYPMQRPLPPPLPQPSSFAPEKVPPPSHPPPPPPPPPPPSPPPLPPQYPMQRPLPPPPPQPSSFAPENVPPPSHPPPPPPPLPPPSPPPLAPALPISPDGDDGAKTEKAETQLIVSDDSDMDMDGDENAKTANVTVEGGSPFRLIQGYSSDENEEESNAGVGSTLVTLHKDNEHSHLIDRNTETNHQKLANAKGNVKIPHGTEQNDEARKYHLKDESNPVKHDIDVPGHIVKDDLSGSEFDVVQRSKRHGRSQRKRSRSKSPQGRSYSLPGANKCSPSRSLSPGRQSRSPLAKRVHPTGEVKDSEDIIDLQEGLAGAEKLDSSSNNLNSKKGENIAPDGALGQHSFDDNLTSEFSRSLAASANASGAHKLQRPCPPSQSQSDLNVLSSAGNESPANQSSGGVPFPLVQGTMSSMARDMPLADSQGFCPPEHMSSSFAQAHPSSSNMIQPTGLSSVATSGLPQTQFQQNVTAPANEFQQNQMRSYPAPDLSHPRPLNLHDQTHQPVTSHQQPVATPVENASVPHPDRWSNYSGIIGLPCSRHQPPYGQQQLPGNLDSGTNLVYPSFQRFPSNLPGSSDLGPVDVGLQSSIKPHFNPFASTFEQTDPCLGIDLTLSPNAVGSFSTKAVEHMNTLSPFDQSFPGSGSHAHESSAEATHNKQKRFRPESTSFAPYDPLIDSIEPSSNSINKVDPGKEKHWSAYGSRDVSKLVNIEVDSKDMLGLGVVAESEVEGLGEVAADTEAGVVENASPEFLGAKDWSSDIPGDIDSDQLLSKKAKDSRSMKLFKNAIADFVKEVLNPSWRQGNMSKEAFKTIVKRTVDKVSSSVPSSHIPKTPAKIKQYMQSSQKKVTKLVMGYVDKYVKL